jgi:hypothetical protein
MNEVVSIVEDPQGQIVGAMVGTPDSVSQVVLDLEDVCPRSKLPQRAAALIAKYGLTLSSSMEQALAAATGAGSPSTPTPPSP